MNFSSLYTCSLWSNLRKVSLPLSGLVCLFQKNCSRIKNWKPLTTVLNCIETIVMVVRGEMTQSFYY